MSMRAGLLSGAAALILVGAGVVVASLATAPGGTTTPAGGSGPAVVVSSPPVDTIPSSRVGSGAPVTRAPAPPVPGTSGDRYAHNVTAGATCSPVGALGFTAQVKPMRCTTTATDPHPRWHTP
jgi:hypothetical protein